MPGVDLNLDLPTLSDTMADIVAKLATALSAIETDLAAQVVPAEINVNSALSLAGNALTNVGSVQMVAGNSPTTPGSLYYTGGEFYMVDATGAVQITSSGSLNVAAVGGFVGDYGGVNPARATYHDISGEFRFTEDTGVWADLVCDDAVLMGSAGSVRLGVDAAITTGRQVIFKSLNAANVSMLVYNGSTSTIEDNNVTRATNPVKVTTLDASGDIVTATDYAHTAEFSQTVSFGGAHFSAGTGSSTSFLVSTTSANYVVWFAPLAMLRVGDQITGWRWRGSLNGAQSATLRLYKREPVTGVETIVDSDSASGAGAFDREYNNTLTNATVLSGFQYFFRLHGTNGQASDSLSYLEVHWDHPQ